MGVVIGHEALYDTQHAFDGVAADYDRANAANAILCAMRARTRRRLETLVPPGSRVLDLGCGAGTDVEHFVAAGYQVTGIDWSAAMAEEARRRVPRAAIYHLGIHQIDCLPAAAFDAVYSSFGPLNCVPDLAEAAAAIRSRLRPGGVLVASVIGRVCPWELALFGLRGQWSRAAIRFSSAAAPVPLERRTVWTRYFTPGEFERVMAAAGFSRIALRALGLFAPPPYMHAFGDRHPSLVRTLQVVDDAVGAWPAFRNAGDHFLIALRRI